ncbi:MAG: NmrA family NAD(P)-binding protein [Mycobacteriales bacterium]
MDQDRAAVGRVALAGDVASAAARHLRDLGAQVAYADLADRASLEAALAGATALFAVTTPSPPSGISPRSASPGRSTSARSRRWSSAGRPDSPGGGASTSPPTC